MPFSIDLLPIPHVSLRTRIPVHDMPGDLWRLVDRFDSVYYNGLDIRIYMDRYRIEDIVGLTYEIREQVVPVYGYASYTYDAALRGQRLIEGNFTVIYKKPYALIERVAAVARTKESEQRGQAQPQPRELPAPAKQGYISNLVDLLEWSQDQRLRYWGQSSPVTPVGGEKQEEFVSKRMPLWWTENLSIYIRYNDPQEAKDREGRLLAIEREHVLTRRGREEQYSLTEVLEGVQILSISKAIEDSGRPVLESYQFLARDIRVLY